MFYKIRKTNLRLIIFFLIIPFKSFAQSDNTFLLYAFDKLSQQPASETVYLHLDKQYYSYGDSIWYKAYTVIGQHHQLSALSGVLYVELISPKDSLVTRQTVQLISGIAWGGIPLPPKLKQGNYLIRAYTNWMRNFGENNFYSAQIRIGGIAHVISKQVTTAHPDVQFFPEGGQLINGVRSRVAVKSVAVNGLGENIKGIIEDNEGNIVADFTTQHLGMGVFALMPQKGKSYKAKINAEGEIAFSVNLPKAKEAGYSLALNNLVKDSIYIKVSVNDWVLNEQKNYNFYIIAQNNGKIYYASQGKLQGLIYSSTIEKNRFPTGITQFTLFSQDGEPLAERIAFIRNDDTLKLNIHSSTLTPLSHGQVKMELIAKNNKDHPVSGSFSVSVINDSLVGEDQNNKSTILNYLLLTSELKGYIETPNYYFTDTTQQKEAALDLLMLTQGYRRFEWEKVLSDSISNHLVVYQPEKSLKLEGSLKSLSGKPIVNGKVTLVSTKDRLLMDTTTDVNGNFKFEDLNISDTTKLVLRARKANDGSNVIIYAKQPDYAEINPIKIPADSINMSTGLALAMQNNYANYLQNVASDSLKRAHMLKEIQIKGTRLPKRPDLPHSANLNGQGMANQIIMGKDLVGCINLSDCLVGKVFGVGFKNGKPYMLRKQSAIHPQPMTVIIDGIITDGNSGLMDELNPNDVYSIEVLRSGAYLAIYGSNAAFGALVITTKRGGEVSYNVTNPDPRGIITYTFAGFHKARTFYSPKYIAPKGQTQTPDLRSTIYWNPNIITDKDGKASFEYFNNDTKGTYKVVVEGIDDDGNLGRQVYRYEVK